MCALFGGTRRSCVGARDERGPPGYFIACAIYMIAEKAADVILADAEN